MSPHSEPRHDSYTISDLTFPFGIVDGLQVDDFREAASEIFFAACRTAPGFGGRRPVVNPSAPDNGGEGLGFESRPHVKWSGVGMAVTSRVKRALGLKMQKKGPQPSRRSSIAGTMNTGMVFTESQAARMRRPMTAAEIMRKQLRMSEEADNRLRKTLTRAIVGKASRRAETTILPLEMIRHLKPSEFGDVNEFHQWQKRKLKILEAALLTYPSLPLEKSDKYAVKFKDIIQASDTKPIDTGKNSETMKALCNCVEFLARRSPDGNSSDACRWADGYPVNVYIYMALLCSIFDIKDETLVLDEVDELLELMKKAWPVLGIDRSIHNLCFFWVLFRQYVATGEVEPNLLGASLAVLKDVESDAWEFRQRNDWADGDSSSSCFISCQDPGR